MPSTPRRASPLPRRREPRQLRARHTCDLIVQAAAQVLVNEGEAAATTNRVAERAGVSVGTLYQYFPDKQAVFRALLDSERQRAVTALDAWLAEAARQRLGLDAIAQGLVASTMDAFAGRTPARRRLARFIWRHDGDDAIALAMRSTIERIAVRLQDVAGSAVPIERLYVVTRAVLGTIRYAALEASPLIASGVLERLLMEMAVAMLAPARGARRPRADAARKTVRTRTGQS